MRKIILLFSGIVLSHLLGAQSVGINNTAPDPSAVLDVKSDTKGMLLPRTSTTSRVAIVNPAKGLMLYDSTTSTFWFHNGTVWSQIAGTDNIWNLAGNTATDPLLDFIGTTDNQPLRFRVNNQWSGEIHPVTANVFFGLLAGNSGMTGIANTAVGENTFVNNTTGQFNTTLGINTLSNNLTGNNNTAIGERVLQFNTSTDNAGLGAEALRQNTSGSQNTALGSLALYSNTVGFFNTACGYRALISNSAGTTLTALGYNADVTANYLSNATALGSGALVDASDKVRIGNTTVKSIGGQVGWSTFSDGRYKQQVKEDMKGLEFIMKLRPVTYNVNVAALNAYLNNNKTSSPDSLSNYLQSQLQTNINSVNHRESGFIAQEVDAAVKQTGFSFSGVDAPATPQGLYSLRYADFVVPIVKAMQEQETIIEKQQQKIDLLEQRLLAIEKKLILMTSTAFL